jgi:hydroxypyruvate reductase
MSGKPKLLLVNKFHPETVARLDREYDAIHLWEHDPHKLIADLQGTCRAAATASWDCNPIVYELESLELIAAFGVGVDGIDFEQTRAKGIRVTNTPDVLNDAVADLAIALILMTTRNLVNADRFLRKGHWLDGPFPFGMGLAGKTLGILGLGRIGEAIAERALPLNLKIAYHNRSKKDLPYRYCDSILELAACSDILLNMLPGGSETRHLINAPVFNELGNQGIFINVGRGSTVDERDLVNALESNTIAGAGLDVYEKEPQVPRGLIESEKTVLLPHLGSATAETRREMGNVVIRNLQAFFGGHALQTEVIQG